MFEVIEDTLIDGVKLVPFFIYHISFYGNS